eukprot:TRINITY_DN22203_c0_g1_i1.p1 TRINITY_DN22203_c0_g1~~TRINITY_DN22203_c0_g1_i1.p1  ORF type:complete len:220 (+),score=79.29 TRINITY_DN22203_c0_g1_i1:59-661(+)
MVLGASDAAPMGFDGCCKKTVDRPKHFRAKPKQVPKRHPSTRLNGTAKDDERPAYEHSARFGCRAADHDDLLTANKGSPQTSVARLSKRCSARPPTALVNGQAVGGAAGEVDPHAEDKIQVGRKQHPEVAAKSVVNVANVQKMPESATNYGARRRAAEFSHYKGTTAHKPDAVEQPWVPGKRFDLNRERRTTGDHLWLKW